MKFGSILQLSIFSFLLCLVLIWAYAIFTHFRDADAQSKKKLYLPAVSCCLACICDFVLFVFSILQIRGLLDTFRLLWLEAGLTDARVRWFRLGKRDHASVFVHLDDRISCNANVCSFLNMVTLIERQSEILASCSPNARRVWTRPLIGIPFMLELSVFLGFVYCTLKIYTSLIDSAAIEILQPTSELFWLASWSSTGP